MITRLIPIFPFNLQNYAYGITNISVIKYTIGIFLFMIPGVIIFSLGTEGTIINENRNSMFFMKQEGKDLGEKMYSAISFSLKEYRNVVLIGSDLPLISKNDIEIAFNILKTKDVVISPTYDGDII